MRAPSPAMIEEARSLMLKVLAHESASTRRARSLEPPVVNEMGLEVLATRSGLKLLRQVAKRVDRMLKERKDQSDALLSVVRLASLGVRRDHLPILPSARTLDRIYLSGKIASRQQANLVNSVLRNMNLVAAIGPRAEDLGQAFDRWRLQQSARSRRSEA